jgi:sugar phosphate isomerase/epimerase
MLTHDPPGHPYATTYFRSIRRRDDHFRIIAENSLRAELYFQFGWDKHSLAQHREISQTIAGELPGCAIHLPYNGQGPAHNVSDEEELDRLGRMLEAARIYEPDHLIGHFEFKSLTDSASGPRKFIGQKKGPLDDPFHEPSGQFVESSVNWWQRVLAGSEAPLYLEHTYEHSPLPIVRVIDLLGPQSGFCLDLGHWFHYAMGKHWDNLQEWITLCGPRLRHLHLHDNHGDADQHLGLGQGDIDLPSAWAKFRALSPRPTFTLENHRPDGLLQSLAYLKENPPF